MSRRDRLEARKRAARERMAARLAAHRGRPRGRRARKSRWRWIVLAIVLICIALCSRCTCSDPIDPPVPGEGVPVELEPATRPPPVEPKPPPRPLRGKMKPRERPDYTPEPPKPLPWVRAYRMQVASRSPRLSKCFEGARQPGTLKWTASVEPGSGEVSDHTLEPVLTSEPLSATQRACVLEVLSEPPYRLQHADKQSTPSRVSMVLEF